MIDQELAIEPPPSLQAILSQQERIGRVDFARRLVAPPAAEPQPEPEHEAGTETRTEPEGATGTEPVPEAEAATASRPEAAPGGHTSQAAGSSTGVTDAPARTEEPASAPAHSPAPLATPAVPVPATALDGDDDFLLGAPDGSWATQATLASAEVSAQVAALLSLVPAEDVATVTEDVDQVVEGVLARIHEVRSATLAHLEAIEVEAALRCEMLTAQAELDAELIRLHARREAHAIIAAARARSGLPPTVGSDVRRLDHLDEATTRFVESLEEQALRPGSPDHPFLS